MTDPKPTPDPIPPSDPTPDDDDFADDGGPDAVKNTIEED